MAALWSQAANEANAKASLAICEGSQRATPEASIVAGQRKAHEVKYCEKRSDSVHRPIDCLWEYVGVLVNKSQVPSGHCYTAIIARLSCFLFLLFLFYYNLLTSGRSDWAGFQLDRQGT